MHSQIGKRKSLFQFLRVVNAFRAKVDARSPRLPASASYILQPGTSRARNQDGKVFTKGFVRPEAMKLRPPPQRLVPGLPTQVQASMGRGHG